MFKKAGRINVLMEVKTLEQVAWESPLQLSVDSQDIAAALNICDAVCPKLQDFHPMMQHSMLTKQEMILDRKDMRNLRETVAYSVLAAYHAGLITGAQDVFIDAYGPCAITKLFDIHYFAGTNDSKARKYPVSPLGFAKKAEGHFFSARGLWYGMARAHEGIAYRHARIADVLFSLYLLNGSRNPALLAESREQAQLAIEHTRPESEDALQVKEITQRVISA